MRMSVAVIVLAACACGGDGGQERDASPPVEALPAEGAGAEGAMPTQASPTPASAMMPIPSDPQALVRLEAMGYTVHREEKHLHAPGVKGCPAMADGPVM